uniref:C3HC-type domain-containing protein n=1 Tax=Strongyloides venezuelensis TaxID=75913 RepID=A0A0K0FJV4_STRVS
MSPNIRVQIKDFMTQIYLSNNEISTSQMMKAVNNQFGGSSIGLTTVKIFLQQIKKSSLENMEFSDNLVQEQRSNNVHFKSSEGLFSHSPRCHLIYDLNTQRKLRSSAFMIEKINDNSILKCYGRRYISKNDNLYCSGCRRIGNKFHKTIRRALGSGHENKCQQVSFISVLCKSIEIHYCDKISFGFVMPADCKKLYLGSLAQLAFRNQINFHDILLHNDFPKLETIYESFRKCKTRSFNKIIDDIDKCIYSNNKKMIFDNYEEGFVAIISPLMLEEFSKTSYIVADATFSTCPKPFNYLHCLYSLNIECLKSVTLCYFLMYTKDANAYNRCLLWLKKQADKYCLKNLLIFNTNKTIMTDKERFF